MDKREAKALLRDKIREYRALGYDQLSTRIGELDIDEVIGQSGTKYPIETPFF